jgi:type II secretory pathway component PulJ
MSLLEMVIATTMFAVVLTSISVLLRTGRQVWEAHEADFTRVEAAHATLRHVVREIRQAESVVNISAAADTSGHLELLMPTGEVRVWDHDDTTDVVSYGITAATSLLAPDVTELQLVGFAADGATQTATPDEVQAIQVTVTIQLPAGGGTPRSVTSWAWLRSW